MGTTGKNGNKGGAAGWGVLTRFSSDNQPGGDSQARGWAKKKRAKELLRIILERNFDPKNLSGEMRQQLSEFYDIPVEDISNEAALYFVQITQGIAKADTAAFNAIMDRAYGKPKEDIQVRTGNNPQFIVEIAKPHDGDEYPTIATSEDEVGSTGSADQSLP